MSIRTATFRTGAVALAGLALAACTSAPFRPFPPSMHPASASAPVAPTRPTPDELQQRSVFAEERTAETTTP